MMEKHASCRGFTLIELMIYLAVAAIIGIPMVMVSISMSRSYADGFTVSRVLERTRLVAQRLKDEYRDSLKGTTVVSADGKSIQFTSKGSFNGTGPEVGPVIRYEIVLDSKEISNGLDDDSDGLIDDGLLQRVDTSTGERLILSKGIDYTNSSFSVVGTELSFKLETFGCAKETKSVNTASRFVEIYPRN